MSQPEITVDDTSGGGGEASAAAPSVQITEIPSSPKICIETPTIEAPSFTITDDAVASDPVKLMKEGNFNAAPPGLGVPGKADSKTSRISARFRAVGNLVSEKIRERPFYDRFIYHQAPMIRVNQSFL